MSNTGNIHTLLVDIPIPLGAPLPPPTYGQAGQSGTWLLGGPPGGPSGEPFPGLISSIVDTPEFRAVMANPIHAERAPADPAKISELLKSLPSVSRDLFDRIDKIAAAEETDEEQSKGWKCAVCLEGVEAEGEETGLKACPCNHLFHQDCLEPWLLTENYSWYVSRIQKRLLIFSPSCRLDLDPLRTLEEPQRELHRPRSTISRPQNPSGGDGRPGDGRTPYDRPLGAAVLPPGMFFFDRRERPSAPLPVPSTAPSSDSVPFEARQVVPSTDRPPGNPNQPLMPFTFPFPMDSTGPLPPMYTHSPSTASAGVPGSSTTRVPPPFIFGLPLPPGRDQTATPSSAAGSPPDAPPTRIVMSTQELDSILRRAGRNLPLQPFIFGPPQLHAPLHTQPPSAALPITPSSNSTSNLYPEPVDALNALYDSLASSSTRPEGPSAAQTPADLPDNIADIIARRPIASRESSQSQAASTAQPPISVDGAGDGPRNEHFGPNPLNQPQPMSGSERLHRMLLQHIQQEQLQPTHGVQQTGDGQNQTPARRTMSTTTIVRHMGDGLPPQIEHHHSHQPSQPGSNPTTNPPSDPHPPISDLFNAFMSPGTSNMPPGFFVGIARRDARRNRPPVVAPVFKSLETWVTDKERSLGWRCDAAECVVFSSGDYGVGKAFRDNETVEKRRCGAHNVHVACEGLKCEKCEMEKNDEMEVEARCL